MKKIVFLVFLSVLSVFSLLYFFRESYLLYGMCKYAIMGDYSSKMVREAVFFHIVKIILLFTLSVISILAFIHILKSKAFKYEVKYTYEEYKAKRDAEKAQRQIEKADREAAQRASRRAELERELEQLKKTE